MIKQKSDIEYILNSDLNKIQIVEKEKQNLIVLKTKNSDPNEKEIGSIIKEVKKHNIQRLDNATYGAVISDVYKRQNKSKPINCYYLSCTYGEKRT